MKSSALLNIPAKVMQRVRFDLVGYFECELRIFGFAKCLRLGKPVRKPLPDRYEKLRAEGGGFFELNAVGAEKLDQHGFENRAAHEDVVDQVFVVPTEWHVRGHDGVSLAELFAAYQQMVMTPSDGPVPVLKTCCGPP